ncbi:uncharacterized protein TNCV_4150451 [Trichonephila clavipes]|uniref:Uncharacterized protein n=1 Tax=Trichonephila clavipes TaxID=2585209 RepID=A0A8X6W5M4_TRICX|nr:uncharacterized protein TNCV_4150451 [Trichonephila clavipes]
MMLEFYPTISHTCSIGDRSGDLTGQDNMSTLCREHCVVTAVRTYKFTFSVFETITPGVRPSVSRSQTVWLQAFPWPPSGQHTAITGTKVELAFIRKHNRSPHHPLMSSGLTPLASQTAMA